MYLRHLSAITLISIIRRVVRIPHLLTLKLEYSNFPTEFQSYKEQTAKEVDGQRGLMDSQVEKNAEAIAQLQASRNDDAQALAALQRQLVDADDRVLEMSRDLQAARDAQAKATADLKSCTETLAAANNALADNRKEIQEQKSATAAQTAKEKSWLASQLEKMTDAETAKIAAEKALVAMQTQQTSDEKEKEALLKQLKDDNDKMMALAKEFQVNIVFLLSLSCHSLTFQSSFFIHALYLSRILFIISGLQGAC